jgi:hypothetical protein
MIAPHAMTRLFETVVMIAIVFDAPWTETSWLARPISVSLWVVLPCSRRLDFSVVVRSGIVVR